MIINDYMASICVDAQPTETEREMFLEVEAVLKKGQAILKEISQYRGASKEIREVSVLFWLVMWSNHDIFEMSLQIPQIDFNQFRVIDGSIFIQAISNPGEDYQEKARDAVFPLVQQLRQYYDFSLEIGMLLLAYPPLP